MQYFKIGHLQRLRAYLYDQMNVFDCLQLTAFCFYLLFVVSAILCGEFREVDNVTRNVTRYVALNVTRYPVCEIITMQEMHDVRICCGLLTNVLSSCILMQILSVWSEGLKKIVHSVMLMFSII